MLPVVVPRVLTHPHMCPITAWDYTLTTSTMMFNMNHAVFQCNCTQIILVFQSFFSSKSVMLVFCLSICSRKHQNSAPKGIFPFHHHSPRLNTRMITIFNHRPSPCCKKYRRPGVSTIAWCRFRCHTAAPGEWPWTFHEVDHRAGAPTSTAYSPDAGRGVHGEASIDWKKLKAMWRWLPR